MSSSRVCASAGAAKAASAQRTTTRGRIERNAKAIVEACRLSGAKASALQRSRRRLRRDAEPRHPPFSLCEQV